MSAERPQPSAAIRRRPFRITFATRLLIGGLVFSLALIAAVSGFLLVSRAQQTTTVALSNADNRARVVRGLIQHVTAPQARFAASTVARLSALRDAMGDPDQGAAVSQLFAANPTLAVPLPNENLVIFGRDGRVLHTTEPSGIPPITAQLMGVRAALAGKENEGVEVVTDTYPVYDLAIPVQAGSGLPVLGAAVYSIALNVPLNDLAPAVGYPTAMIPRTASHALLRIGTTGMTRVSLPGPLAAGVESGGDVISGTYAIPGSGTVAASFAALGDPLALSDPSHGARHVAAYVGVEAPLEPFFANQSRDEFSVLLLGLTAAAIVSVAVLLFVNRFVRRPVSRLGDGVARIAGGDYSSDIPVESSDELGLLAERVNTMRVKIASYIRHVDGAIARLGEVSHALTTTAGGVDELQRAVCAAAAAITGEGARAQLLMRREDALMPWVGESLGELDAESALRVGEAVIGGASARIDLDDAHSVYVPMFYQGNVTGALMVTARDRPTDADERALIALANNAAIAIENTRLFEQEKETVVRLRELDAMKSDFLSTAQHELRTPVTAIMGQLDLIRIAWAQWDDDMKLGIIGEIEVSTRLLGELLESVIDFSLLSAEHLKLKIEPVDVGTGVREAVDEVAHHFSAGLPVELDVQVREGIRVIADGTRFRQVLRCVLDNAVKFTKPGGSVGLSADVDDTGTRCRIIVRDSGMGIDGQAMPHIYERFFQANSTKTRVFGGLGMGLALAAELCATQGATIAAASTVGEGSTFTMLWPLAAADDLVAAPAPADGFHLALR